MYYYGLFLAEKSIGEMMVNTTFQHAFCRHVRVVERLCFCLTLINIHYCLYNVTYIYVINIV